MISAAIQTTLTGLGYRSHALEAINDDVVTPFVIHEEKGSPEPQTKDEAKAGTNSYEWDVQIGVFDETLDAVNTKVGTIKDAIVALAGSTVNETDFYQVFYEGETPDYDEELEVFYSMINFTINTKNR